MINIGPKSCLQGVDANYFMTLEQKALAKVGADKTSAAPDKDRTSIIRRLGFRFRHGSYFANGWAVREAADEPGPETVLRVAARRVDCQGSERPSP